MTIHGSATALQATPHETKTIEGDSSREKLEALADIICGAGDKAAAGEFNVFEMVDAQIAVVAGELLGNKTR